MKLTKMFKVKTNRIWRPMVWI